MASTPSLAGKSSLNRQTALTPRVIDGADSTLDMMEKVPVNAKNRPTIEIKLLRVTIHANPIAEEQK